MAENAFPGAAWYFPAPSDIVSGMRNTFLSLNTHIVFATKNRAEVLSADVWPELRSYISGIALNSGVEALAVGGIEDHIHVFLRFPATVTVSQAVKRIKGGSSRWLSETFPALRDFAWQEGYAALSVSPSMIAKTKSYIENQPRRHKRMSFDQELKILMQASDTLGRE